VEWKNRSHWKDARGQAGTEDLVLNEFPILGLCSGPASQWRWVSPFLWQVIAGPQACHRNCSMSLSCPGATRGSTFSRRGSNPPTASLRATRACIVSRGSPS